MVDVKTAYVQVMSLLQAQKRAIHSFPLEELSSLWGQALESQDFDSLKKILCLVKYSKEISPLFDSLFIETFHQLRKFQECDKLIVFALGASWRHIIERSHKTGERIDHRFMDSLKALLNHKNPEILEWTLRTIDQMGGEALYFKDAIMKIRLGVGYFFQRNKKASFKIIQMLLKRWETYEGPYNKRKTL